jgi:hypothetical protein
MLLPWGKKSEKRRRSKSPSRRLRLECLEGRFLLANNIFNVTAPTDDGTGANGTLSAAIIGVNGKPATDTNTIKFQLQNGTIAVTGLLPAITKSVLFDGWTQNNGNHGVWVEISGPGGAGAAFDGLTFNTGGCTARGLAVDKFNGNGIVINNSTGTDVVYGCNIGTDPSGTAANKGNTGDGVLIKGPSNYIGDPDIWNIISGNGQNGVEINGSAAMSNTVAGNYIGVDDTGNRPLGNSASGVVITNGAGLDNVGDPANPLGNVISGNGLYGVDMVSSNNNQVVDNTIGLGYDGTTVVANSRSGVRLITSGAGNKIGLAGQGNVISGNTQYGVILSGGANLSGNTVVGNRIGTDKTGTVKKGNLLDGIFLNAPSNTIGGVNAGEANLISGNGGNGITITGSLANGNTVSINIIGLDVTGKLSGRGNGNDGVFITNGSSNDTIGVAGAKDAQNNRIATIISANGNAGVQIDGSSSTVVNCFIGTDITGMTVKDAGTPIGNVKYGVEIGGVTNPANNDTIGGIAGADTRNVISGNGTSGSGTTDDGIAILSSSTGNNILGNYIGVAVDGTTALGNGNNGVYVEAGSNSNNIGGPQAGAGNVIAANGTEYGHPDSIIGAGVYLQSNTTNNLVQGNWIGVDKKVVSYRRCTAGWDSHSFSVQI